MYLDPGSRSDFNRMQSGLRRAGAGVVLSNANGKISTTSASRLLPSQYVSRGGIVQVAPYATIPGSGSANFGPTTGQTALEFVTVGQIWRVRQSGTINQFKIRIPAITGITGFYVKIWRAQGTKYDLVGTSANVVSSIAAGSNTITISIPGVQYGDYIGGRVEWSGGASVQNLISSAAAITSNGQHTNVYSALNTTPASFQYDWAAQTALADFAIIEEVFMPAPNLVVIGDSLGSGTPASNSFVDNGDSSLGIVSSYPYLLGNALGYTSQNVSISGQQSGDLSGRFAADAVAKNPNVVIIEVGVNDLRNSASNASIIANVTSMLNAANAAGISTVVVGVTPFRGYGGATNAMLAQRDLLNPLLQTLVTGSPYFGVYVNPDPLGVYYSGAGAAANNRWSLNSLYSVDGLHMTVGGYAALCQLIVNAIQSQQGLYTGAGPSQTFSSLSVLGNAYIGGNILVLGPLDYGVTTAGRWTSTGPLTITDATASTTTATGALIVGGGIGAGGAGNFSGIVSAAGVLTKTTTANQVRIGVGGSNSPGIVFDTNTHAWCIDYFVGAGNLRFIFDNSVVFQLGQTGNFTIGDTTPSTSPGTGALTIASGGGFGCGGNGFFADYISVRQTSVTLPTTATAAEVRIGSISGPAQTIILDSGTHTWKFDNFANGLRIINDSTVQMGISSTGVVTLSGLLQTLASAAGAAGLNLPSGTAPTSPNSGDMWFDGSNVKFRVGGTTKTFTLT